MSRHNDYGITILRKVISSLLPRFFEWDPSPLDTVFRRTRVEQPLGQVLPVAIFEYVFVTNEVEEGQDHVQHLVNFFYLLLGMVEFLDLAHKFVETLYFNKFLQHKKKVSIRNWTKTKENRQSKMLYLNKSDIIDRWFVKFQYIHSLRSVVCAETVCHGLNCTREFSQYGKHCSQLNGLMVF